MILTKPNTLPEQQYQELEEVKRSTKDIRVYRRVKVILYRNAGYTPDEIDEHTDYSEREQRYIVCRYRHEGIAGLYDRPRSGRPRRCPSHEHPPQHPIKQEDPTENPTENPVPTLDHWARVTLECMQTYHPKSYIRTRAQMLLLRDKEYSTPEIADIVGMSVATVREVFARYDCDKLAGLYRQPGSGRRSKLRNEQWDQFAKWVKEGPKSLGYRFAKWTTRFLRKYIFKRFNIIFSREWIRQKLHHLVGRGAKKCRRILRMLSEIPNARPLLSRC